MQARYKGFTATFAESSVHTVTNAQGLMIAAVRLIKFDGNRDLFMIDAGYAATTDADLQQALEKFVNTFCEVK